MKLLTRQLDQTRKVYKLMQNTMYKSLITKQVCPYRETGNFISNNHTSTSLHSITQSLLKLLLLRLNFHQYLVTPIGFSLLLKIRFSFDLKTWLIYLTTTIPTKIYKDIKSTLNNSASSSINMQTIKLILK